jgi:hypothetical protein
MNKYYDYRQTKEGQRRFKTKKTYWMTNKLQSFLWWIGVAWHNTYSNECTKDFNCCEPIGRWAWIRFKYKKPF